MLFIVALIFLEFFWNFYSILFFERRFGRSKVNIIIDCADLKAIKNSSKGRVSFGEVIALFGSRYSYG